MEIAANTRFVRPDAVVTHFHLEHGDKVADFGAGAGYFIPALSKAVGKDGKVYACEIQKNLVERIGAQAREMRLSNIESIWCDIEAEHGSKLADNLLDAGMLTNTLFQMENKQAGLREIARVLKPEAKFFVIDWTESFQGLGPHSDQVVPEEAARKLLEEAGFSCERSFPAGEHHYGVSCKRV